MTITFMDAANTPSPRCEELRRDLQRLDWVARAKEIDQLVRLLGAIERRTMCEMPGYLRYLTPQWAALRHRCFARDGHRCTACGRQSGLRMHHVSYKRVGTPDELRDVTTRCAPCHAYAHRSTKPGYHHREGQMRMAA